MKDNIETEVKIEIDRSKKFQEIYESIGSPNWEIQRNYLFSFGKSFLRLRHESEKAYITIKGEDAGEEMNKRPEIECEIPKDFFVNFARMRNGQSLFDYAQPPIYYEKSRASAKFRGCQVCLDNFFGTHYLEIEGKESAIKEVIQHFNLEDFPIEKRSYLEMLKEMRCEDGVHRKNI
jgi:adenylate cyclase class IV